jgi:hypothetical protein
LGWFDNSLKLNQPNQPRENGANSTNQSPPRTSNFRNLYNNKRPAAGNKPNAPMENEEIPSKEIKTRPLIIAFIIVTLAWGCSYLAMLLFISDWNERGTFGDSFGAINSLFSGLAFAGIIYTITLQKQELSLQRQELADTRIELRRSADAQEKSEEAFKKQIEVMNLSARLNALNCAVEYYNSKASARLAKGNKIGASIYDSKANDLLQQIDDILEQLRHFNDAPKTPEEKNSPDQAVSH